MASTAATDVDKKEKADAERCRRIVSLVNYSVFQSIMQHMITAQSEPLFIKMLCKNDVPRAVSLLAQVKGLVGIAGLFLNQGGGKLSDAVGRKPLLLVGPVGNMIVGCLIYTNSKSLPVFLVSTVIKHMVTTFSNTVITTAMLADTCQGKEFALAQTAIGATVGLGVIVTPFFESLIIKRFPGVFHNQYLALSVLAASQIVFSSLVMPETLEPSKRIPLSRALSPSSWNPFGFIKLFTHGSTALKKMVSINTFQTFLEGKNQHDVNEVWKREELKLDADWSRNQIMLAGTVFFLAGRIATPFILHNNSPRRATTIMDGLNALGLVGQGVFPGFWIYFLSVFVRCSGVNGAAANAIKALASDRAVREGFGKGEYSAWVNNLRGLAGAAAPLIFGYWYAFARSRDIQGSTVFIVAAFFGAILPQILLHGTLSDDDLAGKPK